MLPFDPGLEFDRQLDTLLQLDYPRLAGMSPRDFHRLAAPLREMAIDSSSASVAASPERVPFVLVVSAELVSPEQAMTRTCIIGRSGDRGSPGFADFEPEDLARFAPIDGVSVPRGGLHLAFDVDRGAETLNVRPEDALRTITDRGRTPLTVAEGIALITAFPQALEKNHCFSLVASRCGDRRVPALWISNRTPKLGWCWAGNPHTWLGSASCASRAGLPVLT